MCNLKVCRFFLVWLDSKQVYVVNYSRSGRHSHFEVDDPTASQTLNWSTCGEINILTGCTYEKYIPLMNVFVVCIRAERIFVLLCNVVADVDQG